MLLPWLICAALAGGRVVLRESFDAPEALEAWTRATGARVGEGPESALAWEEGAVVLTVAPEDQRFLVLSRELPLDGAGLVVVRARMRAEAVDHTGSRYQNCQVFVRFGDQPPQALHVLAGTQPWTVLTRAFTVPDGVTSLTVGLFLSSPGRAWFDDLEVELRDEAWRVRTRGHLVYHLLPGDRIPPLAHAWNAHTARRVARWLGVPLPERVEFFKYPDLGTKRALTGDSGSGHSTGEAVHTLWSADGHEIVHLLARPLGRPPALLEEGLAVYLSRAFSPPELRRRLREEIARGRWLPLETLADSGAFYVAEDELAYLEAGALIAWIVETRGRSELLRLYAGGEGLEGILGMELGAVDAALRAWVVRRGRG